MTAQIVTMHQRKIKAIIWESLLYFYGSSPQLSPHYLWVCQCRVHGRGCDIVVTDVKWILEVLLQAARGWPAVYHSLEMLLKSLKLNAKTKMNHVLVPLPPYHVWPSVHSFQLKTYIITSFYKRLIHFLKQLGTLVLSNITWHVVNGASVEVCFQLRIIQFWEQEGVWV